MPTARRCTQVADSVDDEVTQENRTEQELLIMALIAAAVTCGVTILRHRQSVA